MTRIIGVAGSLRRDSINSALLRAAGDMMPVGATLEIATIKGIPLYDGDLEARDGIPQAVKALKDQIAGAHGLILATPEYNNAIPGVFKNAIDWLSRPPADISRVFHGRPVAVTGATPGGFGTALAQSGWLPVLRTLRMRPFFDGRLMVSRAGNVFDESGDIVDEQVRSQLRDYVHGFVEFVNA